MPKMAKRQSDTSCKARPTRKQSGSKSVDDGILYLRMSMQGNVSEVLEDLGTSQKEDRTTDGVLEKVKESARNDECNQVYGESHRHSDGA